MGDKKEEHMHYVALSRVRNLAGLQILELNEEKICVSPLVQNEMERLRKDATLSLCFTPVKKLPEDTLKLVFHNTRSLHKHFPDLKCSHVIKGAHIMGIAETRLIRADSNETYTIPDYKIIRNDQEQHSSNRPAHGLMVYFHESVKVMSRKLLTENKFEYVLQRIDFKGNHLQIVILYISPACDTVSFKASVQKLAENLDLSMPFVLMGDTNVDFLNIDNRSKIQFIENTLHCKQLISKVTTDHQTVLDHIYSNTDNIDVGTIDCYWSDHKFISAAVPLTL